MNWIFEELLNKNTQKRRQGMKYSIEPIAFVRNNRDELVDDDWGNIVSTIELAEHIQSSSIDGIHEFSHLEIIFYFNKVDDQKIQYEARHPRNNEEFPKVGIFSQRGKNRPNKLGITTVELLEARARQLIVKGLDALDGTPVIDIKPVMKEILPKGKITQPGWSTTLMEKYW